MEIKKMLECKQHATTITYKSPSGSCSPELYVEDLVPSQLPSLPSTFVGYPSQAQSSSTVLMAWTCACHLLNDPCYQQVGWHRISPHGAELEDKCLQTEYVKDLLAGREVVSQEKLQCCCQSIVSPSKTSPKSSKIRVSKIWWNYVLCTYFSTEKYAPCTQKYAPCTGTFWGTGEIRILYVLCTYFARILGYG